MRLAAAIAFGLIVTLAAQAQPQSYRALGTEPFWSLTIDNNKMRYQPADGRPVTVATPRVHTSAAGDRYQTRVMTVSITHLRCSDGMSDRVYPDTVAIRMGKLVRKGCGGNPIGAAAATLLEGEWNIEAIDGRPPAARSNPYIAFRGARLSGNTGCNRFSGGFGFAQGRVQAGALATTRRACVGNGVAAQERRLLTLLSRKLSVSRNPASKLVLTAPDGGGLVLAPR
ncbi:META domain-containing protein [Sphingomonas xinjiangensis]|uniref:Heat shock protein HslJ n=1 Tax=Sphingomonas xinjiangensis TaxID=643568 RepID=A0A840YKB4_9SPHN|nr:META domain-containing protein [Sphingomonas xinjiangensis]MBB5709400.1 heat shock protein HslJ [Sphingomonas xinjiangensis]